MTLGIQQPIAQASREVFLADPEASNLDRFVAGRRVRQTPFRGFLRGRGWEIRYIGRWFDVPEATRQMTRQGPVALLEYGLDPIIGEKALILRSLRFVSVLGAGLDARTLPRAIVSEATRDVIGAVTQAVCDQGSVEERR